MGRVSETMSLSCPCRFLVTAPLQQNGSGTVCSYMSKTNSCFTPQEAMPFRLFGLSLAEDLTPRFTICSPNLVNECYSNSYLSGQCYKLYEKLQKNKNESFRPDFQDCTKKSVDLVFLFDGSGSMSQKDFEKSKAFIKDFMNSIKNSPIKFAALQFSTKTHKVFDFNEYQEGKATKLLDAEPFMKALTNTYQALKYTLHNVFENQSAGASPDSTKVVVIITDGDASDNNKKIVEEYDEKKIIRFVIGVSPVAVGPVLMGGARLGPAFVLEGHTVRDVKLDKLYSIASEPKHNNTFHINNYDGLAGILKHFDEKIFNIEGALDVFPLY
ncbi:Integrin alpha-L [Merluccius polli]|uniref:Integrin alpha-L n=1 Tax=Merluccius polli TaxID=89951 RepID=A0AA47N8I3_MERPO|nr:Integrin alpha-L [Merluccius polli]